MNQKRPVIPFFTDNDVDDRVGDMLRDSGHEVTRLRDAILANSPDPVVAATCREAGLVLITHNVKDFQKIAKNHKITKKETNRLCRIDLGCEQFRAVDRLSTALNVIEFEWTNRTENSPMVINVGDTVIRIHR